MDVEDVSSVDQYRAVMQQIQATAERAARRKGEVPRDHPPPFLLVQNHMVNHNQLSANNSSFAMRSSQMPAPYPPCILPADELKPIAISQMKLETHHRGRSTVVHVLTPPNRMTALMAVVEDEQGTAVLLQLYHQPGEEVVPAEQTLRHGSCYLVKEPFFKAAADGSYSLRVDHPSDILLLDNDHRLLPPKWRKVKPALGASADVRMKGNDAVGKNKWAEAERLYTEAARVAKTAEDEQLAHLNRSLVNLRLGRPAEALADAIRARGGDGSTPPPTRTRTEKSLFREASALYELARHGQCLDRLGELAAAHPAGGPLHDRARERLREHGTGRYDFGRMYGQARATPPLVDCASYAAPVEVRESAGRGRGVFTTRRVAAGEMLVCEKALGYAYAGGDRPGSSKILMNVATRRATVGGQADLLTQIVQKLSRDPGAARSFGGLYHGDYDAVPACEVDGHAVVDSFLVERVISLTGFGAPRTSLSTLRDAGTQQDKGQDARYTTCGVWSLASHINHSCISNSRRSFIGDMLIVRATRDLEGGSELFFWYHPPREFDSYDQAQERLANWGFKCGCALCLERERTPKSALLERQSLWKDLQRFMGSQGRAINIPKAQRTLERLNQTYSAAARGPGAVRLELWDPYFALGGALMAVKKPSEAIEMTLRGFEALGFVISASPPREHAPGSPRPELRVSRWGLANQFSVDAFLTLHQAYKTVAPQLSAVARTYMEVAYSMVVGEKETMLDTYPEIA